MTNVLPAAIGSSTHDSLIALTSAVTKEFAEEAESRMAHGADVLSKCSIAFVGLARNCAKPLECQLRRVEAAGKKARDWRAFIYENDSTDDTKQIANDRSSHGDGKVFAVTNTFNRRHRPEEFAGPRTIELAEYRAACQRWVKINCADFDFVAVVDWDAWGGWVGLESSLSYMATDFDVSGMASVSLLEVEVMEFNTKTNETKRGRAWVHYDCWALRLNSYWDDYQAGYGNWKGSWLPPVGSPPIRVCSAFGGLCVYRTQDYLRGIYSGEDCEHVTFHRTMTEATGRGIYLNPTQRTVMRWIATDEQAAHVPDSPDHGVH